MTQAGPICALLVAGAFATACLGEDVVECLNGTLCPVGTVCHGPLDRCVLPDQLDACATSSEEQSCSYADVQFGLCRSGACIEIGCGNGFLEGDELCDDGNTISGDGCRADCLSDERCGNGIVDPHLNEGCDCGDGTEDPPDGCLRSNSNTDPGAICSEDCTLFSCGDGVLRAPEQCDGDALGYATCQSVGFYSGALGCTSLCRYDTSQCTGVCGNGQREGPEACDGTDVPDETCQTQGFYYGGTLGCTDLCTLDTSTCSGFCGDGSRQAEEQCEGINLAGATCSDYGFYAGGLTCSPVCTIDTANCAGRCGDGVRQSTYEDCDDLDLGAATCVDLGYYNGTPSCTPTCRYDASGCFDYCGDGVVNGPELCDGGPPAVTWCSTLNYDAGALACSSFCSLDTTGCERFGLEQEVSFGLKTLRGVWLEDADNGLVVGTNDTRFPLASGTWSDQSGSFNPDYTALWGTGGEYFAVGLGGNITHFNSPFFPQAQTSPVGDSLYGVWGRGPYEVYAVGSNGTIIEYGPGGWTEMTSPTSERLWSVAGNANTVIAVGENGTILRLTGSTWSLEASPTTTSLTGLAVLPSGEAFAVGGQTLLHFDNVSWRKVEHDNFSGFTSVFAIDANNVFAVGPGEAFVYYDGRHWMRFSHPIGPTLNEVFATKDVVLAVGASGALRSYRHGGEWSYSWSIAAGTSAPHGNALFDAGDAVVAVGDSGAAFVFDGVFWWDISAPTTETLHAGWGARDGTVYAFGDAGTALIYDGTSWSDLAPAVSTALTAAHGFENGPVVVAGSSGTILRFDGAWSYDSTGTSADLTGVWGPSEDDLFAVGAGGTVIRDQGSGWTAMASGVTADLTGIWGTSSSSVYAVGAMGTILHFNGSAWSPMESGVFDDLVAVWGTHDGDVFAVGPDQLILHFDGSSWSRVEPRASRAFTAIGGSPQAVYFASGVAIDRLIRTRPWSCRASESSCTDRWDEDCDDLTDCADPDCSGDPACEATTELTCDDGIDNDGDGMRDCVDSDCADIVSEQCDDFTDNDCDGYVDCEDPDCAGVSYCVLGGACQPATSISCGEQLAGNTVGGTTTFLSYSCVDFITDGAERFYAFTAPGAGDVTATLSGHADHTLHLLAATADGACAHDRGCLDYAQSGGVEQVTFTAQSGETYYLVVDATSGSPDAFTLEITCP